LKTAFAAILVLVVVFAEAAGAAITRVDQHGTTVVDGRKVFPIVLAKGPEPGTTTPSGADALDEVVAAGVNFFKVGPASRPWWPEDKQDALEWNRAAVVRSVHTWVNLATLSDARPGSLKETRLREVVSLLESDPSRSALAMWKGADEPWLAGFTPGELQFAYCIGTSRGDPRWCETRPVADDEHLWVTIQAPRGSAADLAPYTPVTDIHGVDHYPVTYTATDPNLHEVGEWTARVGSVTPSRAVWTTLQVCASGSSDPDGGDRFVLPDRRQERYMIYDAILNGARTLAFYGGNLPRCWNATDTAQGWNWTFWDSVLEGLVREINPESAIAPALVNPATERALPSSDPTTQVVSREGADASELWVIAARSGAGTDSVRISGLPAGINSGTVYTEDRSIQVENGSFTDSFRAVGRPRLPLHDRPGAANAAASGAAAGCAASAGTASGPAGDSTAYAAASGGRAAADARRRRAPLLARSAGPSVPRAACLLSRCRRDTSAPRRLQCPCRKAPRPPAREGMGPERRLVHVAPSAEDPRQPRARPDANRRRRTGADSPVCGASPLAATRGAPGLLPAPRERGRCPRSSCRRAARCGRCRRATT
jgi:hypothetical protein